MPGNPLPINVERIEINDDAPCSIGWEKQIAASELSNGHVAGASGMRAEQVQEWLWGIRQEEDPERLGGGPGDGDHWCLFIQLFQAAWTHGKIPCQLLWLIVVLIPKSGGDYRGIRLLEPIWKVIERIIDHRLDAFVLHNSLHGCRNKRGMGMAIIEAKLAQQLVYLELKPFYGNFHYLQKSFDAMDREWCILILEGYGAGPRLVRLVQTYWRDAIMVYQALGYYSIAFKAGHGVTQGGPLSAKLFNISVNAVVREWLLQLREGREYDVDELLEMMAAFFAIFYVDNAYLASRDAGFLQHALNILVNLFKRVGLWTNTLKTQTMICTPGRIRMQLLTELYRRMQQGQVMALEWNSQVVQCRQCGKELKASSHGHHLADVHDIYQQAVVAKKLLEVRPPVLYTVNKVLYPGALACPYSGCEGHLRDGWMTRRHFRNIHPLDLVKVPKEDRFGQCEHCGM